MAEQAHITSLDALERFRSQLILFLSKTHICIDGVSEELRKTRGWLQSEQKLHWEIQIRKRRRVLDQAEQELAGAKLSSFKANHAVELLAVRRAKQAMNEAEEKLRLVKRWDHDFESSLAPLAKKLESLRCSLDQSLPKAISVLTEIQKTLEAYSNVGAEPMVPPRPAEPSPATLEGQP